MMAERDKEPLSDRSPVRVAGGSRGQSKLHRLSEAVSADVVTGKLDLREAKTEIAQWFKPLIEYYSTLMEFPEGFDM